MSQLYLIRHGQAGPRHQYDALSELGYRQVSMLGEHLAAQRTEFRAAFTGSLKRQKYTAVAVANAYRDAAVPFPEIVEEPLWDEFDLGAVYRALAHPLSNDDPKFKAEYEEMMRLIESGDDAVHRNHNYCDIAVVRAWTEQRYPYAGESWPDFRLRTTTPLENLLRYGPGEKIAIFTSATPIGVWMGEALKLADRQLWRLAGSTYNSGLTTLRVAADDLRVFSFNALPHLPDPGMCRCSSVYHPF